MLDIARRADPSEGDPALTTKPDLLGGAFYAEAAAGLIAWPHQDDGGIHAVNVRSRGFLPFLSDDAVIEVTCRVGAVSAYEELVIEAALHGDRDRGHRALLAHPLVGQHDGGDTLTGEPLTADRDHLGWLS
ncbi:hypothetical protein Drose_18030 [Dactylosporangium roseum]|uniref:Dehydrogenase (DH) domain-containing protein n=1 Tax=Dactylosporangium roseum TaxID=47989 RepID=A0ABY5ZGT9_9ACTN|nr:hypothetical protein [Dactylosporangium roseum]UWZ39933.1 hypothetical protein Drose_18030 [Dactylosporangium roseum]